MSQMPGSLITNAGPFAATPSSYIGNLVEGGQLGLGPVLPNLDANTPPVFLPLRMIVTHVPTLFQYIPNGVAIFKALFEENIVNFDGLEFTNQMQTDGTPVGRDGQEQMVPLRHTRSAVTPAATFPEKIGNPVYFLHRLWMNAMRDPDTQASNMAGIIPEGTTLPPHVASMYSADFFFIQYDTTMRPENVIDGFALTNVFPTDIGSPGYHMNTQENRRLDRTMTYTGIVQHNPNTAAVAKTLASFLGLHRINYQEALPVAQSVEDAVSGEGLERAVAEIYSQFQNLDGAVA
jgi:hypothetical protein